MTIPTPLRDDAPDPFLWLEEVEGTAALEWVTARNAEARAALVDDAFVRTQTAVRDVLDSQDKIAHVRQVGDFLYNLWQDAEHPRGLWRRTTWEQYERDEPVWEILLDVDALGAAEGVNWVWHGANILRPGHDRALVRLSRGGADADVTRELDLTTKEFLSEADDAFVRAESKGALAWIDRDTVFAFTDFGPGSMTPSGYPRTVRRWHRGTPLADAPLVYEGSDTDMYISAFHDPTPGFERDFVSRTIAFYADELSLLEPDGSLTLIDVPESAEASVHREWLLVRLRDDWTVGVHTHPSGSLLVTELDAFLAGERNLRPVFTPSATTSLLDATWTRHHLVLTVLDDVRHRVEVLTPGDWGTTSVRGLPQDATLEVRAVDADANDDLWVVATGYLTPTTLLLASAAPDAPAARTLKSLPAMFDAAGHEVTQRFATSLDGTRVPYFLVRPVDAPGPVPTYLSAYGGFEIALTPAYSATLGRGWLERGGAYVVANIRGGGEYGPAWHRAALKQHRHRAYEDLAAVARDLVDTGVTTQAQLAVQGRSNGGLLTGNMLTQYPELFGAVVIGVPLLDMRRFSVLLAGASWMAEYGDPDDPAQWEFIRTFSPYHLVDAARPYPPVLVTTSTRDDRVHPGHARKMAALLSDAGHDVTYFENLEGGHAGAADNDQAAFMATIAYEFCWRVLTGTR
ncbi:prolyl oligopeptidase [Flavimobilis marinus]|uniref:Prolyl oligopeptidase n=1 Tax=Flavimobilis marinus TaxID=285351 RepID=A0A1I2HPU6_9MICO|nr:prolyl oligopeptidase family serine peptidase [Flavimobilis marinus]GHG56875.1 prolyl oligopeptidase [Flavimobilis marinus]SFF30847.1 prolyl oligopeptidase [Flavimobilis marinus]